MKAVFEYSWKFADYHRHKSVKCSLKLSPSIRSLFLPHGIKKKTFTLHMTSCETKQTALKDEWIRRSEGIAKLSFIIKSTLLFCDIFFTGKTLTMASPFPLIITSENDDDGEIAIC
jgi:hypothetical protein